MLREAGAANERSACVWVDMAQGRFSNPALEPAVAESLFREHVLELQKRGADAYLELLDEVRLFRLTL